jgi:biuret amidohydrolase
MTLVAERSALVVIDMHKGSLEAPGTVFVPGATALYEPLAALISAFRRQKAHVVYVVHQVDPDGLEAKSPFWLESTSVAQLYPGVGEQVVGSPWTEIPEPIAPATSDLVFPKKRYGAFSGNGLLAVLRMRSIDTLILAGVEAEVCVLATAFDAFNNDFRVVVARDCVMGLDPACQAAALTIIAREVGWVMPSAEIIQALSGEARAEQQALAGEVR